MSSEFRQDMVSGYWVLVATGRSKRPHAMQSRQPNYQTPQECVFENPIQSGNQPIAVYPYEAGDKWKVMVIDNKYPAVTPGGCDPMTMREGYSVIEGNGNHEIVITRDHDRTFAEFSVEEIRDVLAVYRQRYRDMAQYECGDYIIIFHNYGREGGASVYHPHSQIISLPILPPDVARSIRGAEIYYNKFRKEVYGVMIANEMSHKKRLVYENQFYVALCPFVSKIPYEVRIYPRRQNPHFELTDDSELLYIADILGAVLRKIKKALNDPAYNFFIHTAPVRENSRDLPSSEFYRWHIEVLPRIKFDAGFEAGTGIEMNIVDPDEAADLLRKA